MTLSQRLLSKNARTRAEAKRTERLHIGMVLCEASEVFGSPVAHATGYEGGGVDIGHAARAKKGLDGLEIPSAVMRAARKQKLVEPGPLSSPYWWNSGALA